MFRLRPSPPPLQQSPTSSTPSLSTSREVTPITPVTRGFSPTKLLEKALVPTSKSQYPPRNDLFNVPATHESSLIDPDFDESTFPLFGAINQDHHMAVAARPDDNLALRQTSTSPRGNQPSDLTAALRKTNSGESPNFHTSSIDPPKPSFITPDHSDMSNLENGARPISVKGRPADKNRRESLAQSIGMGMSWGGISVDSWIRDE